METSTITFDNGTVLSYVNILILRLKISEYSEYVGDMDLTAKVNHLTTISSSEYSVGENKQCVISVNLGNEYTEKTIVLNENCDKVVFNFIISEMEVSP
jgi:hypothetical protein